MPNVFEDRLGNPARLDFVRIVLQMREEEREWLKTSRISLLLAALREWLSWNLLDRWRNLDDDEGDVQIEVDFAAIPDQAQIDWGEPPPDLAR